MGLFSWLFGDDEDEKQQTTTQAPPQFVQAPEYPEAEGARKTWYDKLMEWGGQKGYGAIAPDWGDIWDKAQARVNRYYWGGPAEGGGLVGKIRSSAARRNVSQSPALEEQISQMGMGQGLQLSEMATEQATKEAAFGEEGRRNWLNSIMALTQMKPQVASYTPSTTTTSTATGGNEGIFGSLLGLGGTLLGNLMNRNWLSSILGNMSGSQGGAGKSPAIDALLGSLDQGGSLPSDISEDGGFGDIALNSAQIGSNFLPFPFNIIGNIGTSLAKSYI